MQKTVLKALRKYKAGKDPIYRLVTDYFDKEYYLSQYPDVKSSGIDPIKHYISHGHEEGRDPAPDFSTRGYLARYPDVAAAGMNAFYHYLRFGRFENRVAKMETHHSEIEDRDGPTGPPLSEYLPSLDYAKVSRLLGINSAAMTPYQSHVGLTHILRGKPKEKHDKTDETDNTITDGPELAQQMLAAAKGKTLSLDLWDTILRRHCAPDTIKLRHARLQWLTRISPQDELGDLHPIDLLQMRRMAEADAADGHFEYRISEVAERMAPLLADPEEDFCENFLMQELRIEKAVVYPDPVISELIANHDGRKIVLSDFYMPGTALEELLLHSGINQIDHVYSSSDHMATKRAGHLYDLVMKNEALDPGTIFHIGDRFSADVAAARVQGIDAFHYYSPSHQPRLEKLDSDFWAHVAGDTTVYARGLAQELDHRVGTPPSLEMLSVAATSFVLHVMEQALRHKVEKVFFFTREGCFFRRIYDILVARDVFDLGHYPEAEILEVSRRATFAASLEDFTVNQLMRLWSQYSAQSVSALATTLNIDVELWADSAKKLGLDPDETVDLPWLDRRFVAFVKNPHVARIAREAIVNQRAALLEYLNTADFEPRANMQRVIVDIGWRGTIQDNLASIVSGNIHGCYFGLEWFLNPQPANVSKTGYVFDANKGYPLNVSEVAGLEFLFNAPGGSTIGYRDGVALRDVVPEEEAIVTGPVASMQERLLEASTKIADYVRMHGLVSSDLVSFSREVVTEFANTPPPEVAEAFFRLSHNESFGVGNVHSMHFDGKNLDATAALNGSHLHGDIARRLKRLRWSAAAWQLPDLRGLEQKLSASQQLHLPARPALVRRSSLGQPRVAVLSPAPIRGSGGHRTIYNLAGALARQGYDVHLMHETPADHATDEWIQSVLGNTSLTQHGGWINWLTPAASIATIWYSVRYPAEFWVDDTTQFYFVQDYEAMFNPMGDTFLHAAQSYSWGARHISVGRWLAHSLRAQFGVGVASGGLGVDHSVYLPLSNKKRQQNQIALLYQPEKFRRAPQLCAEALTIVKAKMPQARIVLYGSDQKPHLPFEHENLGLITDIDRINDLYNESAVGLCISSTNPSRIPFEMMASGCVPVDIYRYNNLFDYDAGTGLLAHESPESIAEALLRLLNDPVECAERSLKGMQSVLHRTLEWEMDVAVNAVGMGLDGFDFDEIAPQQPTYTDAPVIAKRWNTAPVRRFMEYQWEQANSQSRDDNFGEKTS
tara:strand:- start:77310 stop:81005 length:3696 start_codon:yes stop_codon:yes gene_type:complete